MSPSKSKQLGRLVRQQREAQGLSIRELAQKARMNHSLIGFIETGERPATTDAIRKLARALRVPIEDLFALSDHMLTETLPDFEPYLRAKFALPDSAIRKLRADFDALLEQSKRRKKGGRDGKRPR